MAMVALAVLVTVVALGCVGGVAVIAVVGYDVHRAPRAKAEIRAFAEVLAEHLEAAEYDAVYDALSAHARGRYTREALARGLAGRPRPSGRSVAILNGSVVAPGQLDTVGCDSEPFTARQWHKDSARQETGWHRLASTVMIEVVEVPKHQIRGVYTSDTITVYQAYSTDIALPALAHGRFVTPFKRDRMTWIKPSFLWMMYRCGWATKPGQERVLAIEITRTGFEWALAHACLSHFDPDRYPTRETWAQHMKTSPVRLQWDPERTLHLQPLPHRSLQVGLGGEAVGRYVDEWTTSINDVTGAAHTIKDLLRAGDEAAAQALLPKEQPYPLPDNVAANIGATTSA